MNLDDTSFLCCGCTMCKSICPKKAIQIITNKEGFLEYRIDRNLCSNCGLCYKKCPQINNIKNNKEKYLPKYFAAITKNETELIKSSSGGIFYELAKKFADTYDNFTIYGCTLKNLQAKHIGIYNIKEISQLMGSKYIQSDMNNCIEKIDMDLKKEKKILFSGTPCQVAAVKNYFGEKNDENLFTIDIICHGVPSPLLFQKYIDYITIKKHGDVKNYIFRDKSKKTWEHIASYSVNGKKYYKSQLIDPYYNNFIIGNTYRESCYKCKYANKDRVGDITLGDFWGAEKEHPNLNINLGCSAVMVNTVKGEKIFEMIKDDIIFEDSTFEKISKHNHNLLHPTERPKIRDNIYDDIENKDFEIIMKDNLKYKITIDKKIKSKIPIGLKRKIKQILKKVE